MIETNFIDVKPISVNKCFQGKRFRTKEFKSWQELVHYKLPTEKTFSENLRVEITLYLNKPTMSDVDNYAKAIIDCVVKKGIIKDDRYIFELLITKEKNNIEGFDIEIHNLDEDTFTQS